MFLHRVVEALDKTHLEYAIVGGFAVALHGAIRGTVDIDIILRLKSSDYEKAEAALHKLGLAPRLPITAKEVFNFREEYIKNRNLIAWSFVNPKNPSEVVDVIITHDLAKVKIKKIQSSGLTLKILALEDLIKMKKSSGRPQDLEDVKALESLKK